MPLLTATMTDQEREGRLLLFKFGCKHFRGEGTSESRDKVADGHYFTTWAQPSTNIPPLQEISINVLPSSLFTLLKIILLAS